MAQAACRVKSQAFLKEPSYLERADSRLKAWWQWRPLPPQLLQLPYVWLAEDHSGRLKAGAIASWQLPWLLGNPRLCAANHTESLEP